MKPPAQTVVDLYRRRAADWDMDRGRDLIERAWLDRFLEYVPLSGCVLDLGCGSGEPIARYLIEKGRSVTGVDAAPEMIALCRAKFPDQTWHVSDMRRLSLGRAFDGLIAWHSAFHLTPAEQEALFDVYSDHVRPGGVLMFTSGTRRGETVGRWRGEPLYHGSLSLVGYRNGLARTGFEVIHAVTGDPECGGANVWLSRRRVAD